MTDNAALTERAQSLLKEAVSNDVKINYTVNQERIKTPVEKAGKTKLEMVVQTFIQVILTKEKKEEKKKQVKIKQVKIKLAPNLNWDVAHDQYETAVSELELYPDAFANVLTFVNEDVTKKELPLLALNPRVCDLITQAKANGYYVTANVKLDKDEYAKGRVTPFVSVSFYKDQDFITSFRVSPATGWNIQPDAKYNEVLAQLKLYPEEIKNIIDFLDSL